jgi:hypothetical protein
LNGTAARVIAKLREYGLSRIILACLMFGLSQAASADIQASGRATLGGAPVTWSTASAKLARSIGVEAPLSLVMFTFSPMVAGNSVSEEQWAKEAGRQGTDIATIKLILGPDVYVTKEGDLASCTMVAIDEGLCGKARTLTVAQRAAAAQSILEQSRRCRWIGFDEGLNATASRAAGAEAFTLWVAADCR